MRRRVTRPRANMEWMGGMSEWFDKVGRDFNRAMKGEAGEKEKAERTGMVSFRDGA